MGCCVSTVRINPEIGKILPKLCEKKETYNKQDIQNDYYNDLNLIEIENWIKIIKTLMKKSDLINYARARKRNNFKNLKELSIYLNNYPTKIMLEKAWLIYIWITSNIQYNVNALKSNNLGDNSSDGVLKSGISVCLGYCNLFKSLCNNIGIECMVILGDTKTGDYKLGMSFIGIDSTHSWNVIKLNNKWYYVEPTWGSGPINDGKFIKKFNPYHFLTPPCIFLEFHHSNSCPLQRNCSINEFINMPYHEIDYHLLSMKFVGVKEYTRMNFSTNPFCLEYLSKYDCEFMTHLINNKTGKREENCVMTQIDFKSKPRRYCFIVILNEKNVNYELNIFGRKCNSSDKTYPIIAKYILKTNMRKNNSNDFNLKIIPDYDISLQNGIRLLSHNKQFISYKNDPLIIELEIPNNLNVYTYISSFDQANERVDDSKNLVKINDSIMRIEINLSVKNKIMRFNIYAKQDNSDSNYLYSGELYLVKVD